MQRTMLAVAILAILALTLGACGESGEGGGSGEGAESDGSGEGSENGGSASISGPGSTPEETFEAIRQAGMNKDGGAIFDLLAPEAQRGMISMVEGMQALPAEAKGPVAAQLGITAEQLDAMTPREFFALQAVKEADTGKDMAKEAEDGKLVDTKIDGDHATLTVDTNGKQEEMHLVKVDGKWYLVGGRE